MVIHYLLIVFFVFFLFFFKWIFLFRRMFPSWAAERTCWISVRWSPLWCWNAASWRCGREAKRRLVSTGTRSRPRCRATTGRRTPVTTSESDTFPYRSVFLKKKKIRKSGKFKKLKFKISFIFFFLNKLMTFKRGLLCNGSWRMSAKESSSFVEMKNGVGLNK